MPHVFKWGPWGIVLVFLKGCASVVQGTQTDSGEWISLENTRCPPTGRWRIGEFRDRPGLSAHTIQRTASAHMGALLGCLMSHRRRTPSALGAQLEFGFFINASGCVSQVELLKHDLAGFMPGVTHCLLSQVLTWQFPRPAGGRIVEARYPFHVQSD